MNIKFDGGEADEHLIEAYFGSESLSGMSRAATLVAHYAATGEVRHRAPYSDDLQFFLEAPANGSLQFPLSVIARTAGALGNHRKKLAIALLSLILARATGQAPESALTIGDQIVKSGDVDALAEAAAPGLLRAHAWINDAAKSIKFDHDAGPVTLTAATKIYMETEYLGDRNSQDVSVAALNGNSKIGRVYFNELNRTVPFKVAKEAAGRTVANLSRYLVHYVNKSGATVNIDYQPVYFPDDRLKRILIFDCYPIDDAA